EHVVAARPTIQRAAYGLDVRASKNSYVDRAIKLWKTNPGMSLTDFATDLLRTIDKELKSHGVPLFGWTFVSGAGAAGIFDSKDWKVKVNVSQFSSRATATTLRDLTTAEITEIVGTLYHEARHTDQDVLIIRSLLDQKKSVDQIFAATSMRKDVIEAVAKTTYRKALDADQRTHAGRMFDVMYGIHKEFLEFLMRHSAAVDGLGQLAQQGSSLAGASPHVTTLRTWQTSVLQPKLKQLTAIKKATSAEKALLLGLQKVDSSLTSLWAGWTTVTGTKNPDPADVDDVRDAAAAAVTAIIDDTYKKLEGEADAFRVEGDIKRAFTQKAAKR
ncbi:MAG TPA: hypothetical protein VFU98_13440, partial [Microlunatus sp.]|nr:hypothetical protein [Microlunatus sp.]